MRSHVLLSFALLLPVGATTIATAADGHGCVGPICCVGTGGKRSWDGGMVFGMPEIVVGNQLRFYYGAMRFEHSATDNDGALGLATLRLDGFVSLEAKDRPGTLVTRPFELAGSRLKVNADTRGGSLAAEVLDQHGRAMAGLSRAECKPLENVDGFRLQLTWDKPPGFSALQGKLVRLKFSLRNAKLYAFQVCP